MSSKRGACSSGGGGSSGGSGAGRSRPRASGTGAAVTFRLPLQLGAIVKEEGDFMALDACTSAAASSVNDATPGFDNDIDAMMGNSILLDAAMVDDQVSHLHANGKPTTHHDDDSSRCGKVAAAASAGATKNGHTSKLECNKIVLGTQQRNINELSSYVRVVCMRLGFDSHVQG